MSAARDEVLRAMARALCSGYGLCPTCESAGQCVGDMNEGAFLDEAKRALAAAEQAGWRLVLASEHERLSDRVAALDEPYVDDRGEHWRAPTAHAYAAVCKALKTCKAERDAARAAAPKATP